MKPVLTLAAAVLLVSACASNEQLPSVPAAEPTAAPEIEQAVTPEPATMAAPVGGVLFPQLQGTWVGLCKPFDEEEPDGSHEITSFDIQGNNFQTNTIVYQDSGCNNVLTSGFLQAGSSLQIYGTLARPAGSVATPLGMAAFMDLNNESYTIDDAPINATLARFFMPETNFNIVIVSGDQFFLGDSDGRLNGESANSRPNEIDMDSVFRRQ